MANITINPSVETLSLVAHNQVPVITTELLAQLYCADIKNVQNNFARNASRFVEGKHFFKLTGEQLKEFRLQVASNYSQDLQPSLRWSQISPKTRSLILWTERGAARHAKMLDTDQAWDVFEKLEDCYFTKKPQEQLVLSNGQHYVVAKNGVVIYHKVLSDRTAKNYLQPTIERQASIVIDIPRENVKHNNTLMPNLHTLNTLYDGYGINGNPLVRLFATLMQAQKDGKPITVKDVSGARLVYEMTEALARQYNQALDNIKRAADNAYSSGMFLPIK